MVSSLMLRSASWFTGSETTTILIWWLRLQRCILSCNGWKDIGEQRAAFATVRKSVKEVLKLHRDDVLLYGEFAAFEGQVFGLSRGIPIMETALRATPCDRGITRVHLARSLVEMQLSGNHDSKDIMKCINVLTSLASCEPFPKDLLILRSDQEIEEALQMFTDHTDRLLLAVTEFDHDMSLAEHMLPDVTSDWICCHGWLVYLTQDNDALQRFYRKLNAATYVQRVENKATDSKRQLWLCEHVLEWFLSVVGSKIRICPEGNVQDPLAPQKLLEQAAAEFPGSAALGVGCAAGWGAGGAPLGGGWGTGRGRGGPLGRGALLRYLTSDQPSHSLAIAFVLTSFMHLYMKEVPSYEDFWQPGHEHRLFRVLRILCRQPSLARCPLLWKMFLTFCATHSRLSLSLLELKKLLYQGLDECPWDKGLYRIGCTLVPPEFDSLVNLMVEKQMRLHAMPEELEPLEEQHLTDSKGSKA